MAVIAHQFARVARLFALLLLALPPVVNAQFTFTTNNGAITITRYSGQSGTVSIPSTINGLPVTTIGTNAFIFSYGLTNITIPTSVTDIQSSAFALAFNLINITIPSSVTNVGISPFLMCHDLTAITVDTNNLGYSSVAGVLFDRGKTTLVQCPGGKTGAYTIPDTVTNIQASAFDFCESLTGVTIPNSVTSIGTSAFDRCVSFGGVTIPNSITSIADSTFSDCYNMTNVTIPSTVTNIGAWAFVACQHLTNLVIPSGVITIDGNAFAGCYSLTVVNIPDSVTSIGAGVFSLCHGVTAFNVDTNNPTYSSIGGVVFDKSQATLVLYPGGAAPAYTIRDSVTSIGDAAFDGCYNLTNVMIPNSVTNIGNSAFADCRNLTSITIPNSVATIGGAAFYGCPLTSVTIPNSVATIGSFVFQSCLNLNTVYFMGNAPSADASVFSGDPTTVYYLPGTTGWGSTFGGVPTTLWVPKIQTGNGGFGVLTNRFGFNINWASGRTVVVEASTSLANSDWTSVATNTLPDGTSYFSDPTWKTHPARFYRLRSP